MIRISDKAKQYLLAALKVFILVAIFWFIYTKITATDSQTLEAFSNSMRGKALWILPLFLGLAALNWSLEIFKWKTVIQPLQTLSFREAAQQSLTALAVSLVTPNRIGEYGAKAFYFPPEKRKQVLLLNFVSNTAQMAATVFFGSIGMLMVATTYDLSFSTPHLLVFAMVFLVLILVGWYLKERELLIKGFSLFKVWKYIKKIPYSIKRKVVVLSVLRYLCFSYLFLKLLRFFEADLSLSQAYPLIFAMYLLVSVIPTIFLFDVVVRGGAALWLFSMAGVPELTVLCTVLAMWVLNFVLPSILGSYFLFTYRNRT
ncbi:lysylphosphatidylglycerol synthase domain-containing protein [Altibacter sp.]|uniref:lysylphosphatidylglycerol synthase domain-containing protein n=1 Tax=Altibacter sp. TaxID=2024823 RepID=UPI00258B3F17|nr:lysylphosphatidylglycerol synthase domain-containing protein [Altibacter sp.]MCW9037060.1 flippase-like domain-containing protein [Altibacter sp.]